MAQLTSSSKNTETPAKLAEGNLETDQPHGAHQFSQVPNQCQPPCYFGGHEECYQETLQSILDDSITTPAEPITFIESGMEIDRFRMPPEFVAGVAHRYVHFGFLPERYLQGLPDVKGPINPGGGTGGRMNRIPRISERELNEDSSVEIERSENEVLKPLFDEDTIRRS